MPLAGKRLRRRRRRRTASRKKNVSRSLELDWFLRGSGISPNCGRFLTSSESVSRTSLPEPREKFIQPCVRSSMQHISDVAPATARHTNCVLPPFHQPAAGAGSAGSRRSFAGMPAVAGERASDGCARWQHSSTCTGPLDMLLPTCTACLAGQIVTPPAPGVTHLDEN